MNSLRSAVVAAIIFAVLPHITAAGSVNSGIIHLKQQKPVNATDITADAQGNLFCKIGGKEFIIPADSVSHAILDKNAELKAADRLLESGSYESAAEKFAALSAEYKFLGWKIYCDANRAIALYKLNRAKDAADAIKPLLQIKSDDPERENKYLMQAYHVLAEILLHEKKNDEAMPVLEKLKAADDPELSAWAFNKAGQILAGQNKTSQAAGQFLQPVILYDKQNENREKSLFLLSRILTGSGDNCGKKYFELLKKDYPDSKFINELKQPLE